MADQKYEAFLQMWGLMGFHWAYVQYKIKHSLQVKR